MADYTPQPVDPLRYRKNHCLRITCKCSRKVSLPLDDVVRLYRVPQDHRVHQVIDRLRCSSCGERPVFVDLAKRADFFSK